MSELQQVEDSQERGFAGTNDYSYWRVWIDGSDVRVARDWYNAPPPGPQLQPQHLTLDGDLRWDKQRVVWRSHGQGASIPSIPLSAFTAWLDQNGAADSPRPEDAS